MKRNAQKFSKSRFPGSHRTMAHARPDRQKKTELNEQRSYYKPMIVFEMANWLGQ
jgi:hypothetical protein